MTRVSNPDLALIRPLFLKDFFRKKFCCLHFHFSFGIKNFGVKIIKYDNVPLLLRFPTTVYMYICILYSSGHVYKG